MPNPGLAAHCSNDDNQEAGAGGRKIGLFKSWHLGKMAESCPKHHLSYWKEAGVFVRREAGGGKKQNKGGG